MHTPYYIQIILGRGFWIDSGYPHDGRADKNPYPHDRRPDKDTYPHDSNNQCTILRLQLSLVMINWLIDMPIVSLTCQNRSSISKLISEWKLYDSQYQLNHNLIIY